MRLCVAALMCVGIIGCGVQPGESNRTTVNGQPVAGQSDAAGPPSQFETAGSPEPKSEPRTQRSGVSGSQPETAGSPEPSAEKITINLVRTEGTPTQVVFEVVGLRESHVNELAAADLTTEQWSALFSVHIGADESNDPNRPPVAGSYQIEASRVQFRPIFPLEPGLRYRARFDLKQLYSELIASTAGGGLARAQGLKPVVAEFSVPKPAAVPTTVVANVYPSADTLPENQLKFYLHFSAPMSRGEAYRRVRLLDAAGKKVADPFLELDEELWDRHGKRFTLFLDPGRIKRGLKPREEVGPVFEEGKSYTLVIDKEWPDAAGNLLREPFRKQFRVGPPDDKQPDPNTWALHPPAAGTAEPLAIKFPEPLDHAMLHRVLVVRDSANNLVRGEIQVDDHETRWRLTPAAAWSAGDFTVEVQTDLEDLAGNSIARVFDVDLLEPISRSMKAETWSVPFQVRPAKAAKDAGGPLHSDANMAEIIAHLIEHENRYHNLETVIVHEKWFDEKKWNLPKKIERLHTVQQGEHIYFEGDEIIESNNGPQRLPRRVSAFDGEKTVSIEFGNSANIHLGRREPTQVFPPHTWGMVHLEVNFPLSVFLRGTEALKHHPKVRRFPQEGGSAYEFPKVESEFVGEERLGDLTCVKIRCKRWYYTKDEPAIQYLWLATERNYLCAKTETSMRIKGVDLPVSESLVEEFREIKPGVWLPVRVRAMHFDYEQLLQNRRVVDRTQSLVVERAVPDPQHPLTKFGGIDIPEALPTYTVGMDGELKNSARHPSPAAERRSTDLQQIIERIRENELLYATLDVSVEAGYRKDLGKGEGVGNVVVGGARGRFVELSWYDVQSRSIASGGKQHYREEKSTRMADGTEYVERLTAAFDGQWTRKRSETDQRERSVFEVAWSSLAKGNQTPAYRAHTALMSSERQNEPLSQMLVSEWRDRHNKYRQSVEYEGDDVIDGLLCHRLRIDTLVGDARRLSGSRFLWLARDCNYLPIRSQWREPRWSQTLPTGISTVSDLREVKKGVWFPYHVTSFAFKKIEGDGLCDNRLIVNWRQDYKVQTLTLDPQADPAVFTTVTVPRGAKINVIDENGEFVGSQVQEQDGNLSLSHDKWLALLAAAELREDEKRRRQEALDALIGKPAPEFPKAEWLNSRPLSWNELLGKVVVLDFWASWCGPCVGDLQRLGEVHQRWADIGKKDTVIIGIHTAGSRQSEVEQAVKKHKIAYPVCIDRPDEGGRGWGQLFNAIGVQQIPVTFVVDQQGKVVAHGRLEEMLSKAATLVVRSKE